MPYQVNAYVAEQNQYRFHASERHYIEQLAGRGGLIRLENVDVDAEQLVLRPFCCDTHLCLRRKSSANGNGSKGRPAVCGSCCTDLEVNLTPIEVERLQELGRRALERLTFAPRDPIGVLARRMAEGSFTELTEAGETALPHQPSGCCALGWLTRDGALHCGINALCEAMRLPLGRYKPDPCYLFPLHYVEHLPGRFFLTVVCRESFKAVGADSYVAGLRCLRRPPQDAPPAVVGLKNEIIHCFGAEFYHDLTDAAEPYLDHAVRESRP